MGPRRSTTSGSRFAPGGERCRRLSAFAAAHRDPPGAGYGSYGSGFRTSADSCQECGDREGYRGLLCGEIHHRLGDRAPDLLSRLDRNLLDEYAATRTTGARGDIRAAADFALCAHSPRPLATDMPETRNFRPAKRQNRGPAAALWRRDPVYWLFLLPAQSIGIRLSEFIGTTLRPVPDAGRTDLTSDVGMHHEAPRQRKHPGGCRRCRRGSRERRRQSSPP